MARRAPTDRTAGEPDPEPADQGNVDPKVPEDPVVPAVHNENEDANVALESVGLEVVFGK